MARYLVIEIEDNEVAGDLAQSIVDGGEIFFYRRAGNEYTVGTTPAKVRGIFGKPSTFCECVTPAPQVKGGKLGWFVCPTCKRARRGWQYPNNLLQAPQPSRIEYCRKQMERLGFIEGLDKNPEEDWAASSAKGFAHDNANYRGKR
jgi:hypothetical protein